MGAIRLEDVHKFFGDAHVVKGVDLDIADGEFVVFVGPSGCGKSTMLRMIAGLEETTHGKVFVDGENVTDQGAAERGLAMVFQSYALYPHMSVRQNMGFGLDIAGADKKRIREEVDKAAEILQLGPLLDRKPKELSGGQRQRVAIGRCIVREPAAFLFDEPLSNLDAALRAQMRIEIARLRRKLGKTMIYVTHDQVEAMTLADRIVVFDQGVIQQQGKPLELYSNPSNLFVATFIGSPKMNVLACESVEGGVRLADGRLIHLPQAPAGAAHFGVRPEHLRVVESGEDTIDGEVGVAEHLGGDSFLYVDVEKVGVVTARVAGGAAISAGDRVALAFDPADVRLFCDAGARLG